jgi:5'-nucleotidase
VVANAVDTKTNKPIGGAAPFIVKTFGPLKVGFIGLVITGPEISLDKLTHTRLSDPLLAVAKYLPLMRQQGANVIVAVTHLDFFDDRRLVERFPAIDLIIGGHEHYPITATAGRALITKAGSDARWVARIDLNRRRVGGTLERFFELIPINNAIPDDARTAEVVASFENRLGAELDAVVGTSSVPLDADTVRLRAQETNLGDFFADALRADTDADIAIMNAGSIRGDRVYPAGPLTRRTLVGMHPFGGVICTLAVPGRVVLQALNNGAARMPATAGQFAQVAGVTYTIDAGAPPGSRVRDVLVKGQPIDPAKTYILAITDFMLKGGDGYTMFADQRVIVGPEGGSLLVNALEKLVVAQKEIAPKIEGRITIR